MTEEDIFHIARSIGSSDERCRFLENACGPDSGLRQRVVGLLDSYSQARDFLEVLPSDLDQRQTKADGTTDFSSDDIPAVGEGSLHAAAVSGSEISPPPPLGKLGAYLLMEEVGAGGMGRVARAIDSRLNREVAIKVLAPALVANPQSLKRFLREAQSAALVKHENVVTIYNIEDLDGIPFLVMEFVHGKSLDQHLAQGRTFSSEDILRIGLETARGLEAAHRRGLVHRDIKPANLLLEDPDLRVKITDFGLARTTDDISITSEGNIAGTPQYMSPEQTQGAALDQRSDLFSFGAVLYALCTGKAAFNAETTLGVLRSVCCESPAPIRDVRPDIPPELAAIVERLMQKKPEDRFQTSADVVRAFSDLMPRPSALFSQVQIQPLHETAVRPAGRRRSAVLVGLLAAGLLLAIVASVIVLTIRNGKGTIVLEIDQQAGLSVSVDGDEITITDTRMELPAMPGKHRVIARVNGKTLKDEEIEIVRDKRRVVSIRRTEEQPKVSATVPKAVSPTVTQSTAKARSAGDTIPKDAAEAKALQESIAKELGIPVEFTNSANMKFRLIPAGEFDMGDTDAENEALVSQFARDYPTDTHWATRFRSQIPRHRVVLTKPFYLGTCEVTQGQYEKITGKNPSAFSPSGTGKDKVAGIPAAELPVDSLSWNDAVSFCQTLSEKEKLPPAYLQKDGFAQSVQGSGYRLPTEAEWEFACRAGTKTQAWSGEHPVTVGEGDWLAFNSDFHPHPVGQKKPNPFGLFDLHGNVDEWVQDVWEPAYAAGIENGRVNDPTGPPGVPSESGGYVIRGGTWGYEILRTRSTLRAYAHPMQVTSNLGFRVAVSVEAVKVVVARKPMAALSRPKSAGRFSLGGQVPNSNSVAAGLADFDGDGDLDAVSVGFFQPTRIFLNDGQGNMSPGQELATVAGFSVSIGDMDRDGDADILLVSTNNDESKFASRVWLNDGRATFTEGVPLGVLKTNEAALGDLDGDGDLDIVSSTWRSRLFVWANDGIGQFGEPKDLSEIADHTGVVVGDIDGDGDLDVVSTDWQGLTVLKNEKGGKFERLETPSFADNTSVALADLEGDGDLDAFVTRTAQDCVLLNDGTGRFSDSNQRLGTRGSEAVALADLDGDGDIDAVTVPSLHEENRTRIVWHNDGRGTFELAQEIPPAKCAGLAVGDLNGDGALDLWLAGADDQSSQIWFNQSLKP